MFGKSKSKEEELLPTSGPDGDPWDAETLVNLEKNSGFSISITHIERQFRHGAKAPKSFDDRGTPETIITGVFPFYPQHVHVEITFDLELDAYGEAYLTHYLNQFHKECKVNLPFLGIILRDGDNNIKNGIFEALRDSVMAGRSDIELRIWPTFQEGWSAVEPGAQRVFAIDGVQTWAALHSPTLAKWAYPIGECDLDTYPNPLNLRAAPKDENPL